MLWEAIILGIITGWLRKGSLKSLNQLSLPGWPLVAMAILFQAVIWVDFATDSLFLEHYYPYLYITSFFLLLTFLFNAFYRNSEQVGFLIAGIGVYLNLLVISANGGLMPVDSTNIPLQASEQLASGDSSPYHTAISDDTRLELLGDTISLPYKINQLLSIGDLILAAGVFYIIQHEMTRKR